MRTKTILLTAAVLAAGFTASLAQSVYSVNSVGYVNQPLVHGFTLLGNPLNGTNNSISTVLPVVPDSTAVYRFNTVAQKLFPADTYFNFAPPDNGWYDVDFNLSTTVLPPGIGFFIYNASTSTNITFVGDVPQGTTTNAIAHNFGLYSSIVPQAANFTTLGFPPTDSMVYYKWSTAAQKYDPAFVRTYFNFAPPDNAWYDADFNVSEPSPAVGEGFLIYNPNPALNWVRTFSVN